MAYNTPPTKNTGDTFTASEFNTYIRDNMSAGVPDIFEAEGDLAVGSGQDAAIRLPKGSEGQLLKIVNNIVSWGSLLTARQGGNAISWSAGGVTNYLPTQVSVQVGCKMISLTNGTGSLSVTYPIPFVGGPLIWLFISGPASSAPWFEIWTQSATTLTATVHHGTTTGDVNVNWLAIGPSA
jgi:hypothetical protein